MKELQDDTCEKTAFLGVITKLQCNNGNMKLTYSFTLNGEMR